MGKQKYTAEQIIAKLHEAEVLQSQGKTVAEAFRQIGISDMTYYKWGKRIRGLRQKRRAVREVQEVTGHSERRVCKVLEQPRSKQRLGPIVSDLDVQITKRIVSQAMEYGRYGYRRITAMLRNE